MFEKFWKSSAAARLLEEQLYEQVVTELSQGQRRDGLWAKALSNSDGIEEKAKALYIRYRVQSIKDEIEISQTLAEEAEKQAIATPILERQKRIDQCQILLQSKGHKLICKGSGWVVKEPLGGRQPIASLDELEIYANSREKP